MAVVRDRMASAFGVFTFAFAAANASYAVSTAVVCTTVVSTTAAAKRDNSRFDVGSPFDGRIAAKASADS